MNHHSIRWRLPASYAVVASLAALALGSVMLLVLRSHYVRQEQEYLNQNAVALQPIFQELLQSDPPENTLQDQINGLAFLSQAQIRLLDPAQNVIVDSGEPATQQIMAVAAEPAIGTVMFSVPIAGPVSEKPVLVYSYEGQFVPQVDPVDRHLPATRADILLPLHASPYGYGFVSEAEVDLERRSSQVVSVPLMGDGGQQLGILEFSNGPGYGADIIDSVTRAWVLASAVAVAVAALAGWFMSQRVTRPVLALEQATRQMAQGDLRARVDLPREQQQEFLSLAESFNGMAAQVEQTVSALREFVADAAHELHTPLTALQTNLELARDEKDLAAREKFLTRAHEQSERLEQLVRSLLDLSRIEATDPRSTFEALDLAQLVREAGEQFASRAEQSQRLFTLQTPDQPCAIRGNRTQLRQVLDNLLENALKFTPPGGSISVELSRSGESCLLTVGDTGIGIPPEDQPHLFERFHRGRNSSEYAGNGLGLAIVKAVVASHGADVRVQSQPGEGTQVSLTMPLDR